MATQPKGQKKQKPVKPTMSRSNNKMTKKKHWKQNTLGNNNSSKKHIKNSNTIKQTTVTKNKNKNKSDIKKKERNDDWITALVQKASSSSKSAPVTSSSSSSSSNENQNRNKNKKKNQERKRKASKNDNHPITDTNVDETKHHLRTPEIPEHEIVLSKDERIERRNRKKKRRLEKLQQIGKQSMSSSTHEDEHCTNSSLQQHKYEKRMEMTKESLDVISGQIRTIVRTIHPRNNKHNNHYNDFYAQQKNASIRGKATSKQQLTDGNIQPRKRDYGGLGMARPSLLILLRDESFIPKFEEEFQEHINGFFGKIRTKAMKKQLDGNMLWRKVLKVKTGTGVTTGEKLNNMNQQEVKWNGKKLVDMTPDERVEAMIKLGMI